MNKGNYYKIKTKKWFKDKGYFAEYLERNQRIVIGGKTIFIKKDMAGADGMAMNKETIIFWQCKLNKKNVAEAVKEFQKFPYPPTVSRWIVVWIPRAREPEITEVEDIKQEDGKLTSE